MLSIARELAGAVLPDPRGARLLGITLSGFDRDEDRDPVQLNLFG